MVLKLSDFNKEQREEFPHPKVGFITSTANLSVTAPLDGDQYEIDKYMSGCLGGDGNIYFGSVGRTNDYKIDLGNILKFNPKTLETTKLIIAEEDPGFGALICGKDGNIYTIPGIGTEIYKLDVFNESITPMVNSGLSSSDVNKYNSGCLAPNGSIYAVPDTATSILKINPISETATTFGSFFGSGNKWSGAVLGPDGFIYGIPYLSSTVLKINPKNDTVSTFGNVTGGWFGGCLAPNGKIYCPPVNSFLTTSVLKIDPIAETATTFGSIDLSFFTFVVGDLYYGWMGGVLAPNGKIYCSPLGGKGILEINPENDSVNVIGVGSLPPVAEKVITRMGTLPYYRWAPFIQSPDGKMYAPPANEDKILVFGETSNVEPADWLLGPYQNKAF
jgi:hypothetical protein